MRSELERAAGFEDAIRNRCAERIVDTRFGPCLFNDTFARIWNLNVLRADRPQGTSAEEIAAEAERVQGGAGLRHRRVLLPPGDDRLVSGFRELEWEPDPFLFMVRRREPDRRVETTRVAEIQPASLAPLRSAILREWIPTADDELVDELIGADTLMWKAAGGRCFAVFEDGEAVSAAVLYSDGRTAQVEDVATMPAHRGRGHASTVVERAVAEARAAGHDFVFLVAAADDWPKELYRRLGFDDVGVRWSFLRREA
jgi:ribosomal protein S18 acetylase RimI-like enzyme